MPAVLCCCCGFVAAAVVVVVAAVACCCCCCEFVAGVVDVVEARDDGGMATLPSLSGT